MPEDERDLLLASLRALSGFETAIAIAFNPTRGDSRGLIESERKSKVEPLVKFWSEVEVTRYGNRAIQELGLGQIRQLRRPLLATMRALKRTMSSSIRGDARLHEWLADEANQINEMLSNLFLLPRCTPALLEECLTVPDLGKALDKLLSLATGASQDQVRRRGFRSRAKPKA